MTDNVIIALIGACSSVILSAIAAGVSIATLRHGKRTGLDIAETKETIVKLEKNTNGLKDELVRKTEAEALLRGRAEEAARIAAAVPPAQGPPGPQGPPGEPGPQGPKGGMFR